MRKPAIFCSIAAIILCIASFEYIDIIFGLFLSFFKNDHINFVVTAINGAFINALRISIAIGLIPLLIFVAWFTGNILSARKRLFSIAIVLVFIAIAVFINVLRIKGHEALATNLPQSGIMIPDSELFLDYAIFSGAFVGCLVAFFLFRSSRQVEEPTLDIN